MTRAAQWETAAIEPEMIDAARRLAFAEGRPLIAVLEDASGLLRDEFVAALGLLFDYPDMNMAELQSCEPAFEWIAYPDCLQRSVLALKLPNGRGLLVLADPFDATTETWAFRRLPLDASVAVAHADDVTAYLAQQEERLQAMQDIVGDLGVRGSEEVVDEISLARIGDDDSPVIRLVNSTIYDALKMQASDIHLECDAGSLAIKYRVDGVLVQIGQVSGLEMAEQVISRIKVMAELDIAERRIPQDGRFKVRINGREIDFRVSIMPNIFSEDAVLRLLDRRALTEQAQSLRLDNLGFDAPAMAVIRRLAAQPHGMLLVTGPTGSGKTTTLYAAISEIHSGRDKIVTIEDPVEYRLPRVLQIPVNEKKGLTFARGLRSILRHDPDKIMVGEIRDDETAQIAVQAALTGHLVFTTVHANSAFDVLGRFLHMGVDPYSLASALNGIVAQRLLRLNCPNCAQPQQPDASDLQELASPGIDCSGWNFKAGTGCGHCRGTGYKGRRAVAEILTVNDTVRELIVTKAPVSRLRQEAQKSGLRPLRDTALQWVASGETTLAEVARVAG
jgi:general secretion pathway protein E